MPPSKIATGSPEDWLARAKGDLALAHVALPPNGFYEDLCFHAQQAAEKAIKAVVVRHGWAFPYVHDLAELVGGLERRKLVVPMDVKSATPLTTYANETQYPGVGEPMTAEDHRQAVEWAIRVVRWAEGHVTGGE